MRPLLPLSILLLLGACTSPEVSTGEEPPAAPVDGGVIDQAAPRPDGAIDLARRDDSAVAVDLAQGAPDLATPPGPPGKLAPGASTRQLTVAGKGRSILVYAPQAVAQRPLPLVIALHGNGDSAQNFVAALGLGKLAESGGFIVAAPQGITQSFTVFGRPVNGVDWDAYRSVADGNIDLPLLEALRADLGATGSIDERRVVVFGYSQGGYLSFRYGLEAAGRLACAAVAGAANPLPGSPLVAGAARKIPFAIQIGTGDFAIQNARQSRDELTMRGHPVWYREINGAGHVPFPGNPAEPIDYCRQQALP